jgi:MerR family transcriptional regulator, light-induced transcriptional regulator
VGVRREAAIVVACVEGEQHEFPARLAADALELAGFDVQFLGTDVPTVALVKLLEAGASGPARVSVALSHHVPTLERAVRAIQAAIPDLPTVIGGSAPLDWPGLATRLGVAGGAGDANALVAQCEKLRPRNP